MPELDDWLRYAVEAVKFVGGLASFYAVIKLRQIEKKFLFKATVPEVVENIQATLDTLSECMQKPADHRVRIAESLNVLIVDVRNIKGKARGGSLKWANQFLQTIEAMRPPRRFWQKQTPLTPTRDGLFEIWGQGMGLIRSLEHDMKDQGWTGK